MIDVHIQLNVADRQRRFELDVRWATDAPVTALFGPSGAGKSLSLQAMAGLLRPQAGHVRVGGHTWFDAARGVDLPAQQRGAGYLFQQYALFPHLSVRDNVAFGLTTWWQRLGPAYAQRVDELLDAFGLAGLAHSKPATLSGGQQQRVALARALASRPSMLLLDEPFAALNPLLRQGLREELRHIGQRWQVPIVLITHDVDDVLALADVAFVFDAGAVVRELCLHSGRSRELARQTLTPPPLRPRREVDDLCLHALLAPLSHA